MEFNVPTTLYNVLIFITYPRFKQFHSQFWKKSAHISSIAHTIFKHI